MRSQNSVLFACLAGVLLPFLSLDSAIAQQHRVLKKNGIGLSVYDYSDPKDKDVIPILYFHGTSSSKREVELVKDLVRSKQRLLIAFDRPGYGDSDGFYFGSLDDYVTWSEKKLFPAVQQVIGFKPDKYDLVSVSGGAPYALRTCQADPTRIRKVSILSAGLFARPVGGEGNYERARRFAVRRPRIADLIVAVGNLNVPLSQTIAQKKYSGPDKKFAQCHSDLANRIFVDATRSGARGIVQDSRIQLCDTSYAKPVPKGIAFEIWNGSCDETVSLASAKLLAEKTGIELNVIQNEGHLSSLPISFAKSVIDQNPVAPKSTNAQGIATGLKK